MATATEFRGCLVSIECGNLGYFQGKVLNVDKEAKTITIERPLKDGIPLSEKSLVLFSSDIQDIKIIKMPVKPEETVTKISPVNCNTTTKKKIVAKQKKSSCSGKQSTSDSTAPVANVNAQPQLNTTVKLKPPLKKVTTNFSIENVPVSVLSKNKSKGMINQLTEKSEKSKNGSVVEGVRISVNELLTNPIAEKLPSLPKRNETQIQLHNKLLQKDVPTTSDNNNSTDNSHDVKPNCKEFGEFKQFRGQEVPIPRSLNVCKRNNNNSQGPSGIPMLDFCNGYLGFIEKGSTLDDPIDFNLLKTDFDFDGNLALFDKNCLSETSDSENGKTDSVVVTSKNFRNDENIIADPMRTFSWTTNCNSSSLNVLTPVDESKMKTETCSQTVAENTDNVETIQDPTSEFRGCLVSVDCGGVGYFQGKVLMVDKKEKTITIERPLKHFRNGIPMEEKVLVLCSPDIQDIKVIKMPPKSDSEPKPSATTNNEPKKAASKQRKNNRKQSKSEAPSSNNPPLNNETNQQNSNKKLVQIKREPDNGSSNVDEAVVTTQHKNEIRKSDKAIDGVRISVSELLISQAGKEQPSTCGISEFSMKSLQKEAPTTSENASGIETKINRDIAMKNKNLNEVKNIGRQKNSRRNGKRPSGIPLVDFSNGYSGYAKKSAELNNPIDFNLLKSDFDFDGNLALFDKHGLQDTEEGSEDMEPTRDVPKTFRNDENVLTDSSRTTSWTKNCNIPNSASEKMPKGLRISVNELLNQTSCQQ